MEISIPTDKKTQVQGILTIPPGAKVIVIFAHGSGSGRFSTRNQFVASFLVKEKIGTLLLDLLTPEEEKIDDVTRELRFDIPFLAKRLVSVYNFIKEKYPHLQVAYFGASTGAAAALVAAAETEVSSVVSRGGRPDLAGICLPKVKAPTLLIVGGNDFQVIELNEQALLKLQCPKKLVIVPKATHLFEEAGTLEQVAQLAADWFNQV